MMIGCGRCNGCRLDRARQWAIRCYHESLLHDENIFVTLTYKDGDLTYNDDSIYPSLNPRDLELFWKRLRKANNGGIRYFGCGEYGESTRRPHYHACIFGFDFKDKKYHKTKNGYRLYRSDNLDTIWGHGDCLIGDVTFESASYVARYILGKKFGEQSSIYAEEGVEPEFVRMSRRPGIGSKYLEKYHRDIFPHDTVIVRGGIKSSAPRFYLKKYAELQPAQAAMTRFVRTIKAMDLLGDDKMSSARLAVKGRIAAARLRDAKRPGA